MDWDAMVGVAIEEVDYERFVLMRLFLEEFVSQRLVLEGF